MALEIFKLMGTVAISKDKALKDIKAIQDQAQKASTAMGKSFTKFSGFVEQHSAQIKKAGKYMTVFGGIATAAFAISVKSAANFEEQLANVSTMLDESAMKILPEYRKGLQSLSVDFGESTETLSKGLYDILSASIPPAEAMGVLEVSAKAAAAGITDTGVAADAITTILNSYGLQASEAGRVSDLLFGIVKAGKTTFNELAPAIGKTAATAAMAGLSVEDLGASIATMTRAGIRTEETMTAINGVLIAFLKPTDDAVEAAAKFGLELNTNTLRTLGLTGVMDKLKDATAEQLAAIFPNIRGLKGMAAALGDAEGYARDYALMLNSAGLTQEAFEKQSATLNFKLGQLKEMFNVIKVTIGTALIPVVEDIVKKVMGVLKRVKEWTEANKPLTETIVKWAAAISGVMLVAGPLLIALPSLVSGVNLLAGALPGLATAFAPFLIGGAIVLGLIAISKHLKNVREEAYKTQIGLDKLSLAELDAEIESLSERANELQRAMAEDFKWLEMTTEEVDIATAKYLEYKTKLSEINDKLGILYIQREKVAAATKKETAATEGGAKAKEEEAQKTKELAEASKTLQTFMTPVLKVVGEITAALTPYEQKVIAVNTKYDEMIEKIKTFNATEEEQKVAIEKVNMVRTDALTKLKEEKDAYDKLIAAQKSFSVIMEGITDKIFEFTHTEYEVKLRAINKEYDALITRAKELYTDEGKLAEIIETLNIARAGEIAGLDELIAKEGEDVSAKDKLISAYKTISDKIFELTHTPMEIQIRKLDQQKQAYIELGMSIEEVNKWYDLEIEKLNESNEALGEHTDELKEATVATKKLGILGGESWEGFTTQIRHATAELSNFTKEGVAAAITQIKMHFFPLIQSTIEIINTGIGLGRKMAEYQLTELRKSMQEQIDIILYGYKEYQKILASMEEGGAVVPVSHFQRGGGVDSVLIRATPGEYVVDKPMTDFIKRTGVIPSQLTRAIVSGQPTPAPGMQRGGVIGLGASQEIKYNIGPIYVAGDGDVGKIKSAIKQALDESNLQILRSGSEVIPGVD